MSKKADAELDIVVVFYNVVDNFPVFALFLAIDRSFILIILWLVIGSRDC